MLFLPSRTSGSSLAQESWQKIVGQIEEKLEIKILTLLISKLAFIDGQGWIVVNGGNFWGQELGIEEDLESQRGEISKGILSFFGIDSWVG